MARARFEPDESAEEDASEAEPDVPPGKSKSQVKRELHALKPLVEALIALSARQLSDMPISEDLATAVTNARSMQRGALQRQLRYCVGILAREDHAAVAAALEALRRPHMAAVDAQQEVERWREALMAGEQAVLDELLARYPALDRQHLMQLVRASQRERAGGHPPRSARLLYRYLAGFRENSP